MAATATSVITGILKALVLCATGAVTLAVIAAAAAALAIGFMGLAAYKIGRA